MRGLDIAKKIINKERDLVLIYFDPDVDGLFSGLLPYILCKNILKIKKVVPYINPNRGHGFLMGEEALEDSEFSNITLDKLRGHTIISVDSHIPLETIKKVCNYGINIVSLDHHECGDEFIHFKSLNNCEGVVINNQYPFEREDKRYLSGCGVVFEALSEMYGASNFSEYEPLVGVTLLSDSREIGSQDSRRYLDITYNKSDANEYVQYLINECLKFKSFRSTFGKQSLDRNFIDFTLSPILNSLFRFNKGKEAIKFALAGGLSKSYQEEQKRLLDCIMKSHLKMVNYDCVTFAKIDATPFTDININNFVGLVANRVLNQEGTENVVCFVSTKDGGRASFRSRNFKYDFRQAFEDNGFDAIGHKGAFGIRNILDNKDAVYKIISICKTASKETGTLVRNSVPVNNMSIFNSSSAKYIADENNYVTNEDKTYIKYTGKKVINSRAGIKFKEWEFDGVKVLSFSPGINNPREYLIDISTDNREIFYTLSDFKV